MSRVTRRRALDAVESVVGLGLILLSFYLTYRTFGPIETAGHVDGQGLFSHLVVPPIAALGGGILAHTVPRLAPVERRRLVRYAACVTFAVLAVVPSVGYVLYFGDPAFSKQLSTYRTWFGVALLAGIVVAGVSDLRSW